MTDTTMAAAVTTPGTATATALTAAYAKKRKDRAPQIAAPLLTVTPVTITVGIVTEVYGKNAATGKYYGISSANGHYLTSTDCVTWTDQTYAAATYTPAAIGFVFDETYMYAYSSTGRLWRATIDVFNAWTEITVPDKGPLTTGRPGCTLPLGSGVLLYGNYTSGFGDGSHIWRSTNAGATWVHVVDNPTGKHVHSIRYSPVSGLVWATFGDSGNQGNGLWKSADQGVTWTYMSSNDYGIDMVFVPALGDRPALVVMEGDGLNRPHLMAFPEDGAPGDKTFPLVWYIGAPADAASTRGTTRSICLTPAGDITYFTTTEGGATGTHSGLYVAQGPDFTRAILLKDTTGAEVPYYGRAFVQGSFVYHVQTKFPLPTFGAY